MEGIVGGWPALPAQAESGHGAKQQRINPDRFSLLDATRGHEAGDMRLVAVAQRLWTVARPQDTLGRLGGEEFAVLLGPVVIGHACTRWPVVWWLSMSLI